MKVHAAMIHRGYVEGNTVAGTPVFHPDGFASVEEFLGALGKAIVDSYWSEAQHYRKKVCCDKAREEHPEFEHCPECGNTLKREIYKVDGIDYCHRFLAGTCDSIGGQAWEEIEEAGFDFGPSAFPNMMHADCIAHVHSYGAESLWYCSQGEAARRSHCDPGGDPNTPYGAVLRSHCDVGLRKGFTEGATVRTYKAAS